MNRPLRLVLLLAAFAVGIAAAACSSDPTDSPPVTPVDGVVTVDQDDLAFDPGNVAVTVGDRVIFTNSESALHTVTIDRENVSGDMRRGDVFEWTALEPGEFDVRCDYHPQMRAKITVSAPSP
jgi:plastocyanin